MPLWSIITLHAVILLIFPVVEVDAFDSGKAEIDVRLRDTSITVYSYRPSGCAQPTLLFTFHGLGRKANRMRDNAVDLANRACLLVLAPLFDKERFPNWRYHRAGVVRKGRVQPRAKWTGPMVEALIAWGRDLAGDRNTPYILFGHSAGGQFLSRLSAYSPPAGAKRIVVAYPSAYVLPSLEERAPYGLSNVFAKEESDDRLKAYLALPITIYLGDQDTGEKNLVQKAAARRQGAHHLERGLYVFQQAWELVKEKDWPLHWRLVTAQGVGHSSQGMLRASTAEQALGLCKRTQPRYLK